MSEMRGPRGVRHAVADYLRADLPVRIPALRAFWQMSPEDLPVPVVSSDPRTNAVLEHEPELGAIDRWPLIAVTSGRTSQVQRRGVDYTDTGDPIYQTVYPVRVWSWVRAVGHSQVQDARDDMATVLRTSVLSSLHLGTDGFLVVLPDTVTQDFSEVMPVKGDRFVAGSYVAFTVHATETLTDRLAAPTGGPRDTVSTVAATGVPLPPHPALS